MYQLCFLGLAVFLLLCTRFIGGKWYFGYILGGLAFGIYNEICFEFCWDYSPLLAPMIWRDVPLVVVLGWGLETGIALTLSDRVRTWLKWTSHWSMHGLDILFFAGMGYATETIMSVLHFWKYNNPLLAVPWAQIMGYVFVGLMVSATGRMFQGLINNKFDTNKS
jgi:hypothetical protein